MSAAEYSPSTLHPSPLTINPSPSSLPYWQDYLADIEELRLPYKDNNDSNDLTAAAMTTELPPQLCQRLQRYCEHNRLTPFAVLLSTYMVMLARVCRQTGFVVGYPTAGRNDPATADVVGYFVHPLPMRFTDSAWKLTFTALCRQTLNDIREGESRLIDLSQLAAIAGNSMGKRGDSPMLQAVFSLEDDASLQEYADTPMAQFPLVLTVCRDAKRGTTCHWRYAAARFDEQTIAMLSECFSVLLGHIVEADDDTVVSKLTMVTDSNKQTIISRNTIFPLVTPHETVVSLFRRQVAESRHPWVVKDRHTTLTYRQMDEMSDRLATALAAIGEKGSVTGMLMERSAAAVVAMMGIMKAGHVYLPLSLDYPEERLRTIIDDSAMHSLVYSQALSTDAQRLTAGSNVSLVSGEGLMVSGDGLMVSGEGLMVSGDMSAAEYSPFTLHPSPFTKPEAPSPFTKPEDPAYIIYTSGTTGKPKGVAISHGALAALCTIGGPGATSPTADDIMLLFSNYLFDASINDVFPTLVAGARIVCADDDDRHDPARLFSLMEREHITHILLPPALLLTAGDSLPTALKTLIVGGEAPSPALIGRYASRLTLINAYGPTENTVISTANRYGATTPLDATCIGPALRGVSCYVLDDHRNLLPPGCPGELYVGGLQLSEGYVGMPQLTAQCFIANPYVSADDEQHQQNMRLYATGDIVRQDADGNIFFIGRKDHQVKIRGYRIELHEVESALQSVSGVEQCVASVVTVNGTPQLAAYIISADNTLTIRELRKQLATRLPAYMVPVYWHIAPTLPLNSSGKIDRRKLPELEIHSMVSGDGLMVKGEYSAADISPSTLHPSPSTLHHSPLTLLQRIVDNAMGTTATHVSIDSDLVSEIGLTSLQVIETVGHLRAEGITVTPSDIYRYRTIRDIMQHARSMPCYWANGYHEQKPMVVLVCGLTAAHPFYSNYIDALCQHYSVLVFDTFVYSDDAPTDGPHYVDYLLTHVEEEARRNHTTVYAVTGHSMGSQFAMLLAERLRQQHNPAVKVVAIGTTLCQESMDQFLGPDDEKAKRMIDTMPPLRFGGDLRLVLETQPSDSAVLNGPTTAAIREASAAFIPNNIEACQRLYPDAPLLLLDTSHFRLLEQQYLDRIVEEVRR